MSHSFLVRSKEKNDNKKKGLNDALRSVKNFSLLVFEELKLKIVHDGMITVLQPAES
jgi:hypothetical protein